MTLTGEGKLLRVFLGESDRADGRPLFEAIVHLARNKGMAGATVLRGIEGFGAHSRIHKTTLLELSEDLPMVVEIADTSEKIEALLGEIDALIENAGCGALVTTEKIDIRRYRPGK
jgi:uncharacterized protein